MIDWGRGEYERTAAELLPVAERVIAAAELEPGLELLDLGCGTGNAALLAARAGAVVTALDPAPRLLAVAGSSAERQGLPLRLADGVAEDLPFASESFDRVVSAFAIIFAADAHRAAGELVRVLRPGGIGVVTAWCPEGAQADMLRALGRAVSEASDRPAPEPFPWGDPSAVERLFEPLGVRIRVEVGELPTVAASPEAVVRRFESRHPLGMCWRETLERTGGYDEPRARAVAALAAGNENGASLRVTSRYLLVRIDKP